MAKAKAKKKSPEEPMGGPFLAAAFFCESILEDTHGKLRIEGIIDTMQVLIHPLAPKDIPSEEKQLPLNLQLLLIFRSGDSPGKHRFRLEMVNTKGKRTIIKDEDVVLTDPPQGGLNIKSNVTISMTNNGGLIMMDVYLDDMRMTRIPVSITVVRPEMPFDMEPKKDA